MLHGFGDSGDMWAPVAECLRRITRSSCPICAAWGSRRILTPATQRRTRRVDIAGVMDHFKVAKADLVTHDIGNMVGYALAAQYPGRITNGS